ncbi:MAG: TRAP transporter small permease subunit [Lautropia sp.]
MAVSDGLLDRIQVRITWLDAAAATGSAIGMFVLMLIVFVDVLMRYAFDAPLSWSYDFVSIYLTTAIFYLALSETLRRNQHVGVDILYSTFALRWRRASKLVGWLLSFALFALIFVLAVRTAWTRWQEGNVVAGAIAWPTWIPAAIAAFGLLLILARLGVGSLALAIALLGGRAPSPAMAGEDVVGSARIEPPADAG